MTATPNPWPVRDADTEHFWDGIDRGELLLQRCQHCQRRQYYPRAVCRFCSSDRLDWVESDGRGTVYSFTVSRRAPYPEFTDRLPLIVALVDLDDGPRMLANIVGVDPEELSIGDAVGVTFIEVDDGIVLPAFGPASDDG